MQELREVVRRSDERAQVRHLLEAMQTAKSPLGLGEAARTLTGRIPEIAGVSYWMDAALLAAAGIPTVNYGPTGTGAHEAVEWVDLDSVVSTAHVLVETARRFCLFNV